MMPANIVKRRASFFLAVEGKSEQSFVAWPQMLAEKRLRIHLDAFSLGGGGFKSMLQKAVRQHQLRSEIVRYQERFLIVDRDRAEQGDWSIEKLNQEAAKHSIIVCAQCPNHEGLLLRMTPGMERETADATSALTKLKNRRPNYRKPMNAHDLERKFLLDDLLRVASVDPDLQILLKKIGLMT
jgi:hypothetical protein